MDNQEIITEIIFIVCSVMAVSLAFLVVYFKNPIYSSISLIASFIPIAIIFLLLHAPFVAIIEILVYAGAIMVLFTFVIMMVDLKKQEYSIRKSGIYRFASILLSLMFFILVPLISLGSSFSLLVSPKTEVSLGSAQEKASTNAIENFGSTRHMGEYIFGKTDALEAKALENSSNSIAIISFELSSILIMVAVVGVFVLARSSNRRGG